MKHHSSERGQALVLIVVGMIGLIGLTALAIDGGNAYSDRRHAQNAADTAALASALAMVRGEDLYAAGLTVAAGNGYNNDTTTNSVSVVTPPDSGLYSCTGTEGSKINPDTSEKTCTEYIQVTIISHVETYFARIIGWQSVTNRVDSVTRAIPGGKRPIYGGSAVASMNPTKCKSLTFQGGAGLVLDGSGVYVNSSCADQAFFNNANAGGLTSPCLYVVGGITANPAVINVPSSCQLQSQPPKPGPQLPDFECSSAATISGTGHEKTMTPGSWDGGGNKTFPPTGVKYLDSGKYCIYNADFTLNGGDTLIGHDVVIYIADGKVQWNGGATVTLDAPGDSTTCSSDGGPYRGLLLYVDKDNHSPVSLNGGGAMFVQGTILAPGSVCSLSGGGTALAPLQSQIVCSDVTFTGSSATYISYNACAQYQPIVMPVLQQTK